MTRFRLARPAREDIDQILATSAARWGTKARRRYAALLASALRHVATNPDGPLTKDRAAIAPGIRSFHIRHASADSAETKVRAPVHILYFRSVSPELVEIVRVLHERMEPGRHVGARSRVAEPE